jgi:LPPG:FO 2-phospho-L-lactate transferase
VDALIVLLSGGVGGAKLAEGLAALTGRLVIIGNTGDDLEWYGLRVCPDLDIVMYTLAGLVDRERGWGLTGDTFHALEMLGRYGEPGWFRLGDRDLATALLRTRWLEAGIPLTDVTGRLCRALGIEARLLPMCNDPVRTVIVTSDGELPFQEYFVARAARDEVHGIRLAGVETARLSGEVSHALDTADLIVFAPSNPFVSLGPILSVLGMRDAIRRSRAPKIGVSPLIQGRAVKGPAEAMMRSLGHRPDAVGVAIMYQDLLDMFVIDTLDAGLAPEIQALGLDVEVRETLMTDAHAKRALAAEIVRLARIKV